MSADKQVRLTRRLMQRSGTQATYREKRLETLVQAINHLYYNLQLAVELR
jgi:hypothetical protein